MMINLEGGLYFFAGYIGHLVLDGFGIEEKQYFYPLKIKIKGFLPSPSRIEMIFVFLLVVLLIFEFLSK